MQEKTGEQAKLKVEMLETSLSHVVRPACMIIDPCFRSDWSVCFHSDWSLQVREFEMERSLVAAKHDDELAALRYGLGLDHESGGGEW